MMLSEKYKRLIDDDDEVIITLNKLQEEDLIKTEKYLKSRLSKTVKKEEVPSPVNMCRLKVVQYLREQGDISKDVIESLKKDVIKECTQRGGVADNPFRSWGSYFRMFYTCFYLKNQKEIRQQLADIAESLQKDLNLSEETTHNTADFSGSQHQGAAQCWLAVYNKIHKKSAHALQLFVQFNYPNITYGLYRATDESLITKNEINVKTDTWNYENVKSFLEQSRQQIIDDFRPVKEVENKQAGEEKQKEVKAQPLNQILYGPPGTGKTFNAVNHAVAIIERKEISQIKGEKREGEEGVKSRFDTLVNSGVIAFTTFHQSYGYEDFVEGLKVESEDNQLIYDVKPGVFKALCEKATLKVDNSMHEELALEGKSVWKMSLGNSQTDEADSIFQECHDNSYVLLGYGDDIDFTGCDSQEKVKEKFESSGQNMKPQDYAVTSVNTFINRIRVGDIIVVSDGNQRYRAIAEVTGEYEKLDVERDHWFQMRKVKWHLVFEISQPRENLCKLAFSQMTLYELRNNTLNRAALQELLTPPGKMKTEPAADKPHVLIIDEINRGNISKIFGELITLIEQDKREGSDEALSVTLPYSKKKFTVPNNIHIIGTMNTADASIAKLDVALRRRFDFIEMPPKPSLLQGITVAGVNVEKMLESINQRIELLYDREHTIGHSFFMGLKSDSPIEDLAGVFEKNIIPLLQEYFFDDWERIHWVLDTLKEDESTHFVKKHLNSGDELKNLMGDKWFSDNNMTGSSLWALNKEAFEKPKAYIGIYPPEAE